MKLLITTDNFLPRWDGVARFLNEILPRLKGYDITVVAPNYGPIKVKGFELVQLPLSGKTYGDYSPAKYDYAAVEKHVKEADIVFNQTLGPIGVAAIRAAKRHNIPCVAFTHSIEWELFPRLIRNPFLKKFSHPFIRFFVRKLYTKCSALIVPSEQTAEQLTWHKILTTKRVAHLGVDTNKFKPGSKSIARKKLKLPKNAFIIGYHGRISAEKNLITLLRAFIRLKVENKHLLIVGDGDASIKSKFKRKDVTITGMQADVREYLHAMDVYVLPSFTETTSLSVLEAMASGLPVISSKVGYIRDYIAHNKNGFFFKLYKTHDLVKKIERVHNLSKKDLTAIKAAARATIESDFRWENTAKKISLYLKEFTNKEEQ